MRLLTGIISEARLGPGRQANHRLTAKSDRTTITHSRRGHGDEL